MLPLPVVYEKTGCAYNTQTAVLTASLSLFSDTFWSSTEVNLRPASPPSPADIGAAARMTNEL